MKEDLVYILWLNSLSGINGRKITALLEHFGTAANVYNARYEEYEKVEGLSRINTMVLKDKDLSKAEDIIKNCEENGVRILAYNDSEYPDSLRKTDSPPYVLYVKGEKIEWEKILPIAVVGTRRCTDYGVKATDNICYSLARNGVTIVSGMAKGVDTVAARAAIRAGSKTIAVLGCGLDIVYPKENEKLMQEITKNGAVVSEYPPGSPPIPAHFPERNRIISGLSKGVLVVEAPNKSGALITATYALDNGRDVFSVPGSIFEVNSRGTNKLIQQGAKPVVCAEDILEEYPNDVKKLTPPELSKKEEAETVRHFSLDEEKYKDLGEKEKLIIGLLVERDMHIEEIMVRTKMSIAEVNSVMPLLEMFGFVKKLPGDNYKLEV